MKKRFTIILIVLSLMGLGHTWAQQLKFDCQLIDAGTMTEDDAPRTYLWRETLVTACKRFRAYRPLADVPSMV